MPAERPDPTDRNGEPPKRRGLSPGLLLMAVVALVITILAFFKSMP